MKDVIGKFKGFGFVSFDSYEVAKNVVEDMNG